MSASTYGPGKGAPCRPATLGRGRPGGMAVHATPTDNGGFDLLVTLELPD